ncbi:amidase [Nocardia speluncae]|uniref:amidase n=1 Tax=Nocardia speluncae TaxID=419477 RepID=A0A846XCY9_9NOCA|nr:amidase family protein [Nocardia speluncae]NKY32546.1 amidase [Nocardia speluncae]
MNPPLAAQESTTVEISPWQASTVADLRHLMNEEILTSEQITQTYLDRIQRYDSAGPRPLNSIVDIDSAAIEHARARDHERRAGRLRGPLHGIPFVVKTNICAAGVPTTAGNLGLATYRPSIDAPVVRELRAAGGIVLATTNMSEFAWHGTFTTSSIRGTTANIFDTACSAGGSSGGSSVAVAAGFAPIALGTDSCGSVVGPAVHAGLVGFRPSSAAVSGAGVVPLSPAQDVVGPIGRTVQDVAEFADLMTGGRHAWLATTRATEPAHLRFAYLTWPFDAIADRGEHSAQLRALADETIAALARDFRITRTELPELDADYACDVLTDSGWTDARASIDLFLARTPARYGPGVNTPHPAFADLVSRTALDRATVERWLAANPLPNAAHDAAAAKQRAGSRALTDLLTRRGVDVLVYPTAADTARPGRAGTAAAGISSNTGAPSVQVPIGTIGGLPVGLTVTAAPGRDHLALAVAAAVEAVVVEPVRPPGLGGNHK